MATLLNRPKMMLLPVLPRPDPLRRRRPPIVLRIRIILQFPLTARTNNHLLLKHLLITRIPCKPRSSLRRCNPIIFVVVPCMVAVVTGSSVVKHRRVPRQGVIQPPDGRSDGVDQLDVDVLWLAAPYPAKAMDEIKCPRHSAHGPIQWVLDGVVIFGFVREVDEVAGVGKVEHAVVVVVLLSVVIVVVVVSGGIAG